MGKLAENLNKLTHKEFYLAIFSLIFGFLLNCAACFNWAMAILNKEPRGGDAYEAILALVASMVLFSIFAWCIDFIRTVQGAVYFFLVLSVMLFLIIDQAIAFLIVVVYLH